MCELSIVRFDRTSEIHEKVVAPSVMYRAKLGVRGRRRVNSRFLEKLCVFGIKAG